MLKKKILLSALIGVAALSAGSALANTSTATSAFNSNAGVYIGAQLGYGDTNWSDLDVSRPANPILSLGGTDTISYHDTGLAGGLFAGYDINQYLAVETGYVYFPRTDLKINGKTVDHADTYGIDLIGKITVPVVDNFGLYAKAGPGYLHTAYDHPGEDSTHNFDLVYGFGANYQFNSHLIADVSFTRFNGNHKVANNSGTDVNGHYQPNADLYAVGLAYKFNV